MKLFRQSSIFLLFSILFFSLSSLRIVPGNRAKIRIPDKPYLVVGIVVDQMRYDYLFKYWDKLGPDGFKKLVGEGFLCKNVNYNYMPTFTGPGHASIFTGTTPAFHGIISNDWYDRDEETQIYCVSDNTAESVGTTGRAGKMSPVNMRVSTVTDELRLWSNMKSRVIGISLKDRSSILPAGHAANAAYWFEPAAGNFITSSFYMKSLPAWVTKFNDRHLADDYSSRPWNLLLPREEYYESGNDTSNFENPFKGEKYPAFSHNLPLLKKAEPELIRKTPFGNSLVKDFAIETIRNERLGKGDFPDFLTVSFSSTDYVGHQFGPASLEIEDTYLRLDRDIADLLNFIEDYTDKNTVLVFLTADHGGSYSINQLDSARMPAAFLDMDKMKSDLESSLRSKYGEKEGKWISSLSDGQVFLNRRQLAKYNLNTDEVISFAATQLEKTRGILRCYTAAEMRNTQWEGIPALLQRGYHPKRSGDILILPEPGYIDYGRKGSSHGSPYTFDTHVPLLWYGWKIQHGESEVPIDITDIAPTVASYLQISAPSGCTGKLIEGMLKKGKK